MICAGCNRELEPGDRYIEAPASRFLGVDVDPDLNAIMADLLSGTAGTIVYCEGCTQDGGEYELQVYDGEDEDGN